MKQAPMNALLFPSAWFPSISAARLISSPYSLFHTTPLKLEILLKNPSLLLFFFFLQDTIFLTALLVFFFIVSYYNFFIPQTYKKKKKERVILCVLSLSAKDPSFSCTHLSCTSTTTGIQKPVSPSMLTDRVPVGQMSSVVAPERPASNTMGPKEVSPNPVLIDK